MDLTEKFISGERVFDGKILHVGIDTVELPNGNRSTREYIRHVGAVAILPLADNGDVVMERQFRYPVGEVVYELPAGKLDSKNEPHLEAAMRELSEETGLIADEWIYLGKFYPAAAYTDEILHLYIAKGLHEGDVHPDEDEFVITERIPLDELAMLVAEGKVPDAKTQTLVMRAVYMKQRGML